MTPAAPTNLSVTTQQYTDAVGQDRLRVYFSWEVPRETVDGHPLENLYQFEVQVRQPPEPFQVFGLVDYHPPEVDSSVAEEERWPGDADPSVEFASMLVEPLTLNTEYELTVVAVDTDGNRSPTPTAVSTVAPTLDAQSTDYVAGTSGWRIDRAGAAEFLELTARGLLTGAELIVEGEAGRGQLHAWYDAGNLEPRLDHWIGQANVDDNIGVGVATEAGGAQIVPDILTSTERPCLTLRSPVWTGQGPPGFIQIAGKSADGSMPAALVCQHIESDHMRTRYQRSDTALTLDTTSFRASNLGTNFRAPPRGAVKISICARFSDNGATTTQRLYEAYELRIGLVIGSGTVVRAPDNAHAANVTLIGGESQWQVVTFTDLIEGLTPFGEYNVTLWHRSTSAASVMQSLYRIIMIEPSM